MIRFAVIALTLLFSAQANAAPNYQSALAHQRWRVENDPSAAAWNDLGALLLANGEQLPALSAFNTAIELDPDNATALYNAGVVELDHDPPRARKLLHRALATNERDPWIHYRLGEAYQRLARDRKAINHYARAFELGPSLLFPEVNPLIVENQLATRALLHADPGSGELVREPRFAEPAEIRELLLEETLENGQAQSGERSLDTTAEQLVPNPQTGEKAPVEPAASVDPAASVPVSQSPDNAEPGAEPAEPTMEQRRRRRARRLADQDNS